MSPCRMATAMCFLVLFALLPLVARGSELKWSAISPSTFAETSVFHVEFVGNGTDITVEWAGSNTTSFSEFTTFVSVALLNGTTIFNTTRATPVGQAWSWQLENAVPNTAPAELVSVSVLVTTASHENASSQTTMWTSVGLNTVVAHLSFSETEKKLVAALDVSPRNYTCRWTATTNSTNGTSLETVVTAPLTFSTTQYTMAKCVVPAFDPVPAGTPFAMALVEGSDPVPPIRSVVTLTGAIVTGIRLPSRVCVGQNVSVDGFFFTSATYACGFGSFPLSPSLPPESATLVVCPLPNSPGEADRVVIYEFKGAVEVVGIVNQRLVFASCSGGHQDSSSDPLPYWAWILIGLGGLLALAMVGLVLAYFRPCCPRSANGEYEQLIYKDNPIADADRYHRTSDSVQHAP